MWHHGWLPFPCNPKIFILKKKKQEAENNFDYFCQLYIPKHTSKLVGSDEHRQDRWRSCYTRTMMKLSWNRHAMKDMTVLPKRSKELKDTADSPCKAVAVALDELLNNPRWYWPEQSNFIFRPRVEPVKKIQFRWKPVNSKGVYIVCTGSSSSSWEIAQVNVFFRPRAISSEIGAISVATHEAANY